ncbi:heparan-alpha-glucosaminide N-acetyltransferase [Simiduia aestuariiviva]|uniref:Putative membrane protein n=1 Tax=Simiduia aestuariiviva TaxID=1510459 RepID=A0A839UNV0_9GAMM|nr:heparan-alpha-glucosaminide N-acetyltransferase [Simiduia aestuariiviva]MBB3167426.1 putative membrane protein [Simiduia aestuariiviva]
MDPYGAHVSARNVTVDIARTLAIVLMVIFHFIYDLKYFDYLSWDIPNGPGWREFRYLILTLFFICVGIGLVYAHVRAIRWQKFWRREAKVFVGALLVTTMSLLLFPNNWIYFGVLHFILVASLLALPLMRMPRIALLAGLIMLLGHGLDWWPSYWPFHYAHNAWPNVMPINSNDWVPLIPWLGVVWIGIFIAHSRWLTSDPLSYVGIPRWCVWPGKHSLVIYLIHQPILVGSIYWIGSL